MKKTSEEYRSALRKLKFEIKEKRTAEFKKNQVVKNSKNYGHRYSYIDKKFYPLLAGLTGDNRDNKIKSMHEEAAKIGIEIDKKYDNILKKKIISLNKKLKIE